MARKHFKISKRSLFAGLLCTGILFFFLPQNLTKGLNFLFVELFNPLLLVGRRVEPGVYRSIPDSRDFVNRNEYDKLLTAYDNLLADLTTFHKSYEKLSRIQVDRPKPGAQWVLGRVINVSISGLGHELVINRGQAHGLKHGQYVLGEDTIIGTISETNPSTARVRLLTDTRHSIEASIWRKGRNRAIRGRLTGDGKGLCKVPLVPKDYDVKVGDTVYAAVIAEFLETPRVIGKVCDVKPAIANPLLLDITVKPIYDTQKLTDVAVILVDPEDNPGN